MKRKIVAYYSISIGVAVILMWIMILLRQEIPEGKIEMIFHLVSEFVMAFLILISGFMLIYKHRMGKLLNIAGLGMVLYSVLNAAGYYGESDNAAMMIMFSLLFLFTFIAVILNLKMN
jgi:hypothetical protein